MMPTDAGGSYAYSYVQQIYKPEEIGISCDITDIAFRYQSTASTDAGTANLDIYLSTTQKITCSIIGFRYRRVIRYLVDKCYSI